MLTAKGAKILKAMRKTYGPVKGKAVFYAMIEEHKLSGVEKPKAAKVRKRTK